MIFGTFFGVQFPGWWRSTSRHRDLFSGTSKLYKQRSHDVSCGFFGGPVSDWATGDRVTLEVTDLGHCY